MAVFFFFLIPYLTKVEIPCSVAVLPVFPFSLGSETFALALCFSGNLILLISFSNVAFNRFPTSTFFALKPEVFMFLSTHAVILGAVM